MPSPRKTNSIAARRGRRSCAHGSTMSPSPGNYDSCGSAMPLLRGTWVAMNSPSGRAPTRAATPNGAPLAIQCVRAFYPPPELLAGQHNVSQFECRPRADRLAASPRPPVYGNRDDQIIAQVRARQRSDASAPPSAARAGTSAVLARFPARSPATGLDRVAISRGRRFLDSGSASARPGRPSGHYTGAVLM
jgi:hypothetical protein